MGAFKRKNSRKIYARVNSIRWKRTKKIEEYSKRRNRDMPKIKTADEV